MMSLPQQVRVTVTPARAEVKIPLPAVLLADVRAWTRLHSAQWRRTYPSRQVNNLYFDTANHNSLNANLAGVADRSKLRMRWYGPALSRPGSPQLELKRRQGLSGWKEIIRVGRDLDLAAGPWSDVLEEIWSAAGDRVPHWLSRFPVPVLVNTYQREYFETPDGAVRLTIDTALRAFGQRSSAAPNLSRPSPLGDLIVVELKAGLEDGPTQRLSAIVSSFPARVDRFSKFVHGVMAAPDL